MKTTMITAAILAAMTLTAGAAFAQGHRDRPDLASMDTSGDGAVSPEELTAFLQARVAERATQMFARHDTNSDGLISAEEMAAAKEQRGMHRGQRMHD